MKYQTKIYGHRGASQYAPENTLEAFQMAYDMGADGIEFDVQMTKDGHLVVAHDEDISRVSNGKGLICDYTLEELRAFRFNNTHPEYVDSRIPLLTEVLDRFVEKEFLFNIELKNNIFPYIGIEEKVLSEVMKRNLLGRTIFSSFSHKSVLTMRELEPNAQVAFIYSDGIIDEVEYVEKYGMNIAHPAWHHLNQDGILEMFHEKGIMVNVWTVNSGSVMRRLCDMGVDGIITNRPDFGCEIRDDK